MPFAMLLLKKSAISFAAAAMTILGTQVGKVVWDKGLKRFTEKAAEDIFQETKDEDPE